MSDEQNTTENQGGEVVSLEEFKNATGGNGFRKPPIPNKKELLNTVDELTNRMKLFEQILHSTMMQVGALKDNIESMRNSTGAVMDVVAMKITAMTRYLTSKGLIVESEVTPFVTEIKKEMDIARETHIDKETGVQTVERSSVKGDTILCNYSGTIEVETPLEDGTTIVENKRFDGGTAINQRILLGGGGMVDNFDEKLIGMSAGESTVMEVKFPENYPATHLANKVAIFTVEVLKVKEPLNKKE